MKEIIAEMMRLCGCAILGTTTEPSDAPPLSDGEAAELYRLSQAQDLSHAVGLALSREGRMPEGELGAAMEKKMMVAMYRYQRLQYEIERICATLEAAEIAYLPLKGAVLRALYAEPWLRTSCDVDVLVHEEDLDRAVTALAQGLSYRVEAERHFHDISLYSESGIHLELHFNILEDMESIDPMLLRVWEYSEQTTGRYGYRQTPEYLVFHTVAHMSYHFVHGGCGVRPFCDLYLLRHKTDFSEEGVLALCRACGLEAFYGHVTALSEVWLGGASHTPLTRGMEAYLLQGGLYGTEENRVALDREKKGGKARYLLGRIFQPYALLKKQFPVLERHRWLLPVCQVRRWLRLLFGGRLRHSMRELKAVQGVSGDRAESLAMLLRELGL